MSSKINKKKYNILHLFRHRCCTFLCYFIVIILYTVLGAFAFMSIEHETKLHREAYNKCLNTRVVQINELKELIGQLSSKTNTTWELIKDTLNRMISCEKEAELLYGFNFLDGIVYSITVYTTVGYGALAPRTSLGRILTIFYGVIGIPLYMAFSMSLGNYFDSFMHPISSYFYKKFINKKEMNLNNNLGNNCEPRLDLEPVSFLIFQTALITLIGFIYLILVAYFVMIVENQLGRNRWDYIASIHFVFISISMIGFGDLVATKEYYLTIHLPLLFLGQILLAVFINKMIELIRRCLDLNEHILRIFQGDVTYSIVRK